MFKQFADEVHLQYTDMAKDELFVVEAGSERRTDQEGSAFGRAEEDS